ncbi:MAG TPA: PEGA domain-containing protein [Candidatus Binataceae bacterium]|nr:PEGA domain-containing protein [Candidatus Binataceae bacterium]
MLFLLALVVTSSGCAPQFTDKIPISTEPPGASVTVDGDFRGTTPITLKLDSTETHKIQIEKQGYVPYDVSTLTSDKAAQAIPLSPELLLLVLIQRTTKASYEIVPNKISAHLVPIDGAPSASSKEPTARTAVTASSTGKVPLPSPSPAQASVAVPAK